jgi:hypothetical protein
VLPHSGGCFHIAGRIDHSIMKGWARNCNVPSLRGAFTDSRLPGDPAFHDQPSRSDRIVMT